MANVTIKNVLKESYKNFAAEAYRRFPTKSDLSAVATKVNTLIGEDTSKSVRTISAEEVAKVVANADTSYDTLKEIADWILSDQTGAAKMANDINSLKDKTELGTHEVGGEQVEYATVKAYVEAYVAAQIGDAALSGSNAISIINGVTSLIIDSLNANGLEVGANGLKLNLATPNTTAYVAATGTYVSGTTYYTTSAGTATVDTSEFVEGTTDVSSYYVAQITQGTAGAISASDKAKLNIALVPADFEAISAAEVTTIFNEAAAIVAAEA